MKNKILQISKIDKYSILLFLLGFIFAVFDMGVLNFMTMFLSTISTIMFSLSYILITLLLYIVTKIFINNPIRLIEGSEFNRFNSLRLIFVGYFLGFLVNISNAFVITMFDRFIS